MATRPKSKTPKITNIPTLVVVIFQEGVKLPYRKGTEPLLDEKGIGPWQDLKKDFPKIALYPMYTAISGKKLRTLIDRAMEMVVIARATATVVIARAMETGTTAAR